MTAASYGRRLDTLAATWRVWADLGSRLTDTEWSAPTRCPGWDVAAVYAHHGLFPVALSNPPPAADGSGAPVTAVDILQAFNAPGGVATTLAGQVAAQAVDLAAAVDRGVLVERFAVLGPAVATRLRAVDASLVVPWPAADVVTTLAEALRIVLLEATVHLLDVLRALERAPAVPADALRETAGLLAEMAPAVEFVEAATGRSASVPLPVLR